ATIRLKSYRWSDGTPVTSRDIEFWMNLLLANKSQWVTYTPGDWLDFISTLSYPNPTTFRITFARAYSHVWLLGNALSEITPIPQHAWDRTSTRGAVGNYDRTPAGARAVFAFLDRQSKSRTTWDTDPLWQVVDGPFRLEPGDGFDATTGFTILVPNRGYSGPVKPTLSRVEEVPFTSDTAELDSLLAGRIDYGYLPFTDVTLRARLQHQGSRVEPWLDWGITVAM
ncbi:extracellular solute-binding protein family 5, partial [mine drainage metagenome]